jgi:peptide/nickel transport system substrate-binding protein
MRRAKVPLVIAAAAVAAATLSVSLGQSASGRSSSPSFANAASAGCQSAPRTGGTLTYARQTATISLNPLQPVAGNGDVFADTLIYQGLIMPDPTGHTDNLVGAVADRWSIGNGGKTYTFHIRPGIRFSNGQPVTPEDIKYSLDNFANPKLDAYAILAAGYKSTTIVDASTVRVNLTQPTPGLLYNMSIVPAFIVPAKLAKAQGKSFWNHPIGTGPFKLTAWSRGSSMTFAKNPYYWQKGLPRLDKVVYQFVPDDNTRILNLQSHQVQEIDGVPFAQIKSLQSQQGIVIQKTAVPQWIQLWMNHKRAPFKDLRVRQAMEYALDRNAINQQIYAGLGEIPNSILPHLKYDAPASKVAPYPFDLNKAKQLMSKSAFPNGFQATLEYPSGSPTYDRLALVLQSEWAPLGIKLTLRTADQATISKHWTGGAYDIMFPYAVSSSDVIVPDEMAGLLGVYKGTFGFYSWWKDPAIEKMVKNFLHATSETQRAQLWPRIQAAMQQQTPEINVMNLPFVNAHLSNVCNTYVDPLGADSLQYTWLAH